MQHQKPDTVYSWHLSISLRRSAWIRFFPLIITPLYSHLFTCGLLSLARLSALGACDLWTFPVICSLWCHFTVRAVTHSAEWYMSGFTVSFIFIAVRDVCLKVDGSSFCLYTWSLSQNRGIKMAFILPFLCQVSGPHWVRKCAVFIRTMSLTEMSGKYTFLFNCTPWKQAGVQQLTNHTDQQLNRI